MTSDHYAACTCTQCQKAKSQGRKLESAIEGVSESGTPSGTDEPEPSHECQVCGHEAAVDDHQQYTPNWCDDCGTVRTFEKI